MTLLELREYLICGGMVSCDDPQERNELAEFIRDELGFPIGPGTLNYMNQQPNDRYYMNVKLQTTNCGTVVSFYRGILDPILSFKEVASIVESPLLLDDRSNAEFVSDFASLLQS